MIVLDENIYDERLGRSISQWYSGRVISLNDLRPKTLIKDEAVLMLLKRVVRPTFVTINVTDFWLRMAPLSDSCIISASLDQTKRMQIVPWLRNLLHMPPFRTKASRMGKIVLLTPSHISYYEIDRQTKRLEWAKSY